MTIELSKDVCAKIEELARSQDFWMMPTYECSAEARHNFGLYCQEEREGWEQTDHYHIIYQAKMIDWVKEAADESGNPDAWLGLLEDAESLFWEEWGNRPDVYEYWRKM